MNMKSNIKYADVIFIALGIAYVILSILNMFGKVQGKIILLCSIVSFVVSLVQIMDSIISVLKIIEVNVLKVSLCVLQAWYYENMGLEKKEMEKKIKEFNQDKSVIQGKYSTMINRLSIGSNAILTCTMIFFIIGLSTDFVKESSVIADSLTLISFAIIFISLVLHTYLDNYIEKFNQQIDYTINIMEGKISE